MLKKCVKSNLKVTYQKKNANLIVIAIEIVEGFYHACLKILSQDVNSIIFHLDAFSD